MKNNKGIIGKSAILNMIEQLAETSSEALIWMYLFFFFFCKCRDAFSKAADSCGKKYLLTNLSSV